MAKQTKLSYEQLKRIYFDVGEQMDNAKAMSEVPNQKYKDEWAREYEFYKETYETIRKMLKEQFGLLD